MNATCGQEDQMQTYQLTVAGGLNERWITWLGNQVLDIRNSDNKKNTVIKVAIPDQVALRGVINKLWDLNLTLIAVNRLQEND